MSNKESGEAPQVKKIGNSDQDRRGGIAMSIAGFAWLTASLYTTRNIVVTAIKYPGEAVSGIGSMTTLGSFIWGIVYNHQEKSLRKPVALGVIGLTTILGGYGLENYISSSNSKPRTQTENMTTSELGPFPCEISADKFPIAKDDSDTIKMIQAALNESGFEVGKVDGIQKPGGPTEQALIKFKELYGFDPGESFSEAQCFELKPLSDGDPNTPIVP